jgi:hypothetical protein
MVAVSMRSYKRGMFSVQRFDWAFRLAYDQFAIVDKNPHFGSSTRLRVPWPRHTECAGYRGEGKEGGLAVAGRETSN